VLVVAVRIVNISSRSERRPARFLFGVCSEESAASRARVSGHPRRRGKETVVSFANKFRDKAQVLRGRIKRNIGEVTGNRRLQSEGSADKVIGNLKQAGEKVKDAFRGRGTGRR
jgi:uncharacterized protein YjbJ (UPF0337 family)